MPAAIWEVVMINWAQEMVEENIALRKMLNSEEAERMTLSPFGVISMALGFVALLVSAAVYLS